MYSFFLEKRTIVPGQLEEARLVADGKVDVVVNCGDDGNGCTVTAYIHIPGTINDIAFSALQYLMEHISDTTAPTP